MSFQSYTGISRPRNVKQVRQFLGLVQYFRSFIKNYASITAPLRALLMKDIVFEWKDVHERAFENLKQSILQSTVLIYPNPDKEYTG